MPWLILKLDTNPSQLPLLEDLLTNAGAAAVTFEDSADQPLFEPPIGTMPVWDNTRLSAMFDASVNVMNIVAIIKSQLNNDMPPFRIEALEDKDWEREWMDNFHPIQFGQRLWVCPSWRKPPDENAINLLLDPGLAFGTGTHPTTSLCLKWLDNQSIENKHFKESTVIDYGCGSGILAIAARLLGAKEVWATDNDPQALAATKENAMRNGTTEHIHIAPPDQFLSHFSKSQQNNQSPKADILLANILAGPLINLAATLEKLLKLNGKLVLSGILNEQAEEVRNHYDQWFSISDTVSDGDWVRITAVKKG